VKRLSPAILVAILGLAGLVLLSLSFSLPPYKDNTWLGEATLLWPDKIPDSRQASVKYWEMRQAQLTWKFPLQDYGACLVLASITIGMLFLVLKINRWEKLGEISTPRSFWFIPVAGASAGVTCVAASALALILDASRNVFPPWADSFAIPLMGLPGMLAFFLLVVLLFAKLGHIGYRRSAPLFHVFRRDSLPHWGWLVTFSIPLIVSLFVLAQTIAVGDFCFLIPAFLWSLFFLLLLAGKQRSNRLKSKDASDRSAA
jgi:hypothetical protein